MNRKQPKRNSRPGVDEYGRTPLHYAALDGDAERVRQLLSDGADPDAQDDDGWTPLHFACQERHSGVAKVLLRGDADPNLTDKHGNGPLWTAVMNARSELEAVALLLSAGAKARQANRYGRSPHDMATTIGHGLEELFAGS